MEFLFNVSIALVAILFTCAFLSYISPLSSAVGVGFGLVILVLLSVVMVIPGVAVAVRRLHDQGRSGGLVFIGFVPVIGTLILLVLMALPGESHSNRFGSPTGQVILTKQMAHEIGLDRCNTNYGDSQLDYSVQSLYCGFGRSNYLRQV